MGSCKKFHTTISKVFKLLTTAVYGEKVNHWKDLVQPSFYRPEFDKFAVGTYFDTTSTFSNLNSSTNRTSIYRRTKRFATLKTDGLFALIEFVPFAILIFLKFRYSAEICEI